MLQSELKEELIESMQSLNQNEQMVVSLFLHQGSWTLRDWPVLELTTSRISQYIVKRF
ncbi:hypothetical protein [Lentibacillus sp. CBA3610]|uniref:hypothetical protein n=1 Tax=Lentibacillus sp. CBA3610 TaxID=2518176 RepID=UPI0020D22250|nr:hypothetical protein [Lentibacillus sp. CBA3610]